MRRIAAWLLLAALLAGCAKQEVSETTGAVTETTLAAETVMAAAPIEETEAPETEPPTTETQPEEYLLTFVGDCTLGSNPNNYYAGFGFIKTVGEDYGWPFRNVLEYFENDDFTMVNLEGPLCDSGYPVQKKHTFRGPTAYTQILTGSSVEAVTLANNHSLDYGQSGYDSTLAALQEAQVPYVERDSSTILTLAGGLKIGIYGMAYYTLDVEDMCREIADMKAQGAELIIVAAHWGTEGSYRISQDQSYVGYMAIEAGADIVYGSHPHVLQPIEEYHGGIIYYSLGNFSFGGNGYPEDFDTAIVQQQVIRWPDGSVELGELTLIPACISSIPERNNYQPTPYEPGSKEYQRVLDKLDGSFDGPNLKVS